MLPLMAGWMLGFISLMGIPFQDTVKSISWTLAIFLLISIFFWLMTFIGSFVVSMAILLQWEDVNFKAIVLLVIPLIAGFGYGIAACLCRAMTYNVHGVNGAVIFSIGSVVVTLLIAFSAFVGRRFGLCDKVKEVVEF
ncbi:hypothetical protein TSUD_389760 [Trifolium subterraneum]|uniref:Uncharacterized protein n=1 Tax=Trifolium subterraneum TaxID=3900 RepID=A0A2Z6N8J8_TRISU|nr:hypothetical protein TSUD_389760 [Trifolium subterraneum]